MHIDLEAGSREKYLVLYDPSAVPSDFPSDPEMQHPEPDPPPSDAVDGLATSGCAFIVHSPIGDCEASMRVFVDEVPPAELVARRNQKRAVQNAILRIPSGMLVADGIEFIRRQGAKREEGSSNEFAVPGGIYSLEAFDLIGWKLKHRAEEIHRRTSRFARLVGKVVSFFAWTGAILFPLNLLVAPVLLVLIWKLKSGRSALIVAGVILGIDAIVLAFFHLLDHANKHWPVLDEVSRVTNDFEHENPDVVVVLKRPAESDVDQVQPAKLLIRY